MVYMIIILLIVIGIIIVVMKSRKPSKAVSNNQTKIITREKLNKKRIEAQISEAGILTCPSCGHENNLGTGFVQNRIVCEQCGKSIKITNRITPDFEIIDNWFGRYDCQEKKNV